VERERKRAAAAEEAMLSLKDKVTTLQRQADAARRELGDAVAAARQEAQAAAAMADQKLQSKLAALQEEVQRLRDAERQGVSQPGTPALRGGAGAGADSQGLAEQAAQQQQLLERKEQELQAALARLSEAEAAAAAAQEGAVKDRECVMQVQVGRCASVHV
jgi:hypothetical protein